MRPAACWGAVVGGLIGLDYALARGPANGDTLSESIRETVPPWLFVATWAGFNAWFVPHILNGYPNR